MQSLNLLYVHARHMGYGRFGSYVAEEIAKQGITVYDDLPRPDGSIEDVVRTPVTDEHMTPRNSGVANVACWISVPGHGTGWYKDQVPVVFTMWEAQRLPEAFTESLHHFDTVVVPSLQNLELFSQFHDNVKYVPLGVDPKVWHYEPRPEPNTFFNFLIGGSGSRKGTDLAADAFIKVFGAEGSWGDGPIPILMMKNPKGETFYGAQGRIHQYAGRYTDEEERFLYSTAHCYLQPSRGEGFGLQPLQALAMGIPTILTDAHGHASFAKHGIGISATPRESDYFIFGDAGDWWEPNFDELCDAMRDVYDRYALHQKRAKEEAKVIAETFTWEHTANGLLDAIGRDRLTPYAGSRDWFTVEPKRFKIITREDHYCEIAGTSMFFAKGQEYWGLADVKRILFEAGKLHPDCLDDNDPDRSGLTLGQIERAGKYRAEHSHCPTCGQSLKDRGDLHSEGL